MILPHIIRALFLIWIARKILYLTYLWQLKEYRFDRFFVHLKETEQGKELLFSRPSLFKWFLIFAYPAFSSSELLFSFYPYLVIILFFEDSYKTFIEIKNRLLLRPVLTVKAFVILLLSFLFILVLIAFPLTNIFVWVLIADKALPLFIAYLIFLFSIPTEFYYDYQVLRATEKIRSKKKKITVIGITGSYGKSSTKEFIAYILEKKFSVLKTRGTNNTQIGIANTILKKLSSRHEIFVVEMGAYKRCEIAGLCQMVRPQIGVLTAVNEQHNSLFGSLENTMKAKYELIESLPKNGIALFNGNNPNTKLLYEKGETKNIKSYLYCMEKKKSEACVIVATNISVKQKKLTFDVEINEKTITIATQLLGKHNVENLLPAIFIAKILGVDKKKIQEALWEMAPLPQTMQPIYRKGVTFINDTFNANPQALIAALDYIKTYRKKRFLVLQPMIELGKFADREHYICGKMAGEICDYIFLTNNNFLQSFIMGVREVNANAFVSVLSRREISEQIARLAQKSDVVLFEGKEAGLVLKLMEGEQ